MKYLKNNFLMLIFILLITNNYFANNTKSISLSGTRTTSVCLLEWLEDPWFTIRNNTPHLGSYSESSKIEWMYNSAFKFQIPDLPAGSIIVSYTITSYITSKDYDDESFNARISLLDNDVNLTNGKELHQAIYRSSTLIQYNYADTLTNYDISSQITQEHINDGFFILGVKDSSSPDNSKACIYLKVTINYIPYMHIIVDNNFSSNDGKHGKIFYNGSIHPAPFPFNGYPETPILIMARENQIDNQGYKRIWNNDSNTPIAPSEWVRNSGFGWENQSYNSSYPFILSLADENATYRADLRKECNITFNTDFGGGTITVNGSSQSVPKTSTVVEKNAITATAPGAGYYAMDGIYHEWKNWTGSDGTTYPNRTTTFHPTAHTTYTANYDSKPISSSPIYCISAVGDPITIQWTEHPHPDVTKYDIYRKRKGDDEGKKIGTVYKQSNNGTLTFTDNAYCRTASYTDELLHYDARPYYAPDGNYANSNYRRTLYGELLFKDENSFTENSNVITEYALGNYPNPFNPTTTVNYQLPSAGFVTIKVYDMLGKEVASLVNEMKQSGVYNATFNANNLSSGTYLLNIQVKAVGSNSKDFVDTKKILLLK